MKELKFTPKNLERHLNAWKDIWDYYYNNQLNHCRSEDRLEIYTTRDEPKGKVGDVFEVKDVGYFTLVNVIPIYSGEVKSAIEAVSEILWVLEGFKTSREMRNELRHIYGELNTVWVHYLQQVFL